MSPDELLARARGAAEAAYAPYSAFHVGAALVTEGGHVQAAANVENASYGLSMCAERSAVFALVAASPADRRVRTVAIASPDAAPCWPCGACRQVLHEFGCQEVVVEQDGAPLVLAFGDLLPHAFGPEDLEG